MPKQAVARVENSDLAYAAEASPEEMEARRAVAASIRARMAKPATELEVKLWQEFEAELAKERLTFREVYSDPEIVEENPLGKTSAGDHHAS